MASPLENLLIGRTLVGRYEVERVIGRGGMSVVYRATDLRLDRPVALKIVSFPAELDARDREMLRERLRREAASAAKLSPHPNVVQIYDYGTDPDLDLDFIAMELLPGSDLKEVMRQRTLSVEEALPIIAAAARGIAAGHRAGIVHRDVKPANIFLVRHEGESHPEVVKVLDFGIAKALDLAADEDLTRHEQIPHSPGYASPEQLQPGRSLTPASDVFQLGLIAYEALAGERPFAEEDRERIRRGEAVPLPSRGRWSGIPADVRLAVERALALRPEDRFPDARSFGEALTGGATAALAADATRLTGLSPEGDETVWMATSRATTVRPHRREQRKLAPLAVGAAGVALLVWLVATRGPAGVAAIEDEVAPSSVQVTDIDDLDEEFRPLLYEAHENVRDAVSEEEGEEAAAAVQEVIYDVQEAWVQGDLDRHLDHYAERVDFRGASGVSRDQIRAVREESIERYQEREIIIPRLAIEFVAPGRARALVDRTWSFGGSDEIWEGAARDEMILQKTDDRWLVVAERELETIDERRERV